MSSEKTSYLGLNQWKKEDLFLMEEFNGDNAAVDAAVEKCALVRLKTMTLSQSTNQVSLGLGDIDLDAYGELHIRIDGTHMGSGLKTVQMTVNQVSSDDSYLCGDGLTGGTLSLTSTMPLGKLTGNATGSSCGLKVELGLYDQGISYRCLSAAAYSDSLCSATLYVGTLAVGNEVTRDTLESVDFKMETTALKFRAGTTFTLYGVRK
jgi:hypothetical protein